MTHQPYFTHPRRFPGNVEGPFYTTGTIVCGDSRYVGIASDCLQCLTPEHEAPDLLAPINKSNLNTHFVKQPCNADEVQRACNALRVCCVYALRYGGRDLDVIRQLENSPLYCDYVMDEQGELVLTVGPDGQLLPFAQAIVKSQRSRS